MQSLNIVFTGQNQLETRREPVPAPQSGQIQVEALTSLISTGTECICLTRNFAPGTHWDNWVQYPFYNGYAHCGRVTQIADDITQFKVGDRVASRLSHRQIVVADASRFVPVPDGVSDEAAPWHAIASIVQNGVRRAQLELGDTVVVVGLGMLGQLVVQYAGLSGAREVIAIDTAPARLEMARTHGATQILEMSVADAHERVTEITGGRGADVVFDVTGHPAVFAGALGLVRRFGKLLLLGDAGVPSQQCLTSDVMTRGVRIIGAHDMDAPPDATDYHFWTRDNMIALFYDYLARDQMRVDDLITNRFAPSDARAAYDLLLTDRAQAMGVLFDWSRG